MFKETLRLMHALAFGKASMTFFLGKNVVAGIACALTAPTVSEALWRVLPWFGVLAGDLLWYALPWLWRRLKTVPQEPLPHWRGKLGGTYCGRKLELVRVHS
ncbi:MAG TPA: hypothetical protein PLC15_08440 [Candidatus Obscuribacter sp.]|nr:hypothetical protein [Candidatus Obscuribacter sp.]HMY02262.1 hypothetical protein [Candidatus Obscuribacter sp.]HMY53089.1 hypothetical protein [Candidatus Obscuribacter sp.]HNA71786.1 hypothetical protein [Candidatus Obscuribacter sp.]HNB15394.1 hypothetical protein [Candidatus Obscuribacter sp.]